MKKITKMSLFRERFENIKKAKRLRDSDKYTFIPFFESFPRFSEYVPGIMKERLYRVTASTGVGKTQLAKNMYVLAPYNFVKNNPESGIKLKIFYFALEETKDEFIDSLISYRLAKKYGLFIDVLQLRSMRRTTLSKSVLEKILECEEYFDDILSHIEIIDDIYNPTGIYKKCRDYRDSQGIVEKDSRNRNIYTPNDPNEHVLVIVDHINILSPESGANDLGKAMHKWCVEYARKQITKHWKNWTVINIHQQAADTEREQYSFTGKNITAKLEPSLQGLGDNKKVARDDAVTLGLFSPHRYGMTNHMGYNIKNLRDNYRSLKILKNRIGLGTGKSMGLYFDGSCLDFRELPPPSDREGMRNVMNYIEKRYRNEGKT